MVVLGRIVAPFGIQGWVRVHSFADDPEAWSVIPQWWLSVDSDVDQSLWRVVTLEKARIHGDGLIAKLEGVSDRNGAEALGGYYIGAPREAMPTPAQGEYYWSDLIGLTVVNQHNELLGKLTGLIETGSNHVFKIHDGKQERLLPFVDAVIKVVDIDAGIIQAEWELDW